MTDLIRSLFRHFRLPDLGAILAANLLCVLPFAVALVGPIVLQSNPTAGLVTLLGGFLFTGQAIAVTGRVLDRRFSKQKKTPGTVLLAWRAGWAEGLVVTAVLLGLFSLLFQSVPFYWTQGTAFAVFSLVTLALGTILVLGFLPFYLPARRREGLNLAGAFRRSFRLMNSQPLLSLGGLLLGAMAVAATVGTLGLFPGFTGMAALHQGLWDHAVEKEEARARVE